MEEDPAQPLAGAAQTPVSPVDGPRIGSGVVQDSGSGLETGAGQREVDRAFDELFGPDATTNSTATVLTTRRTAAQATTTRTYTPVRVRRYNPYAAIPCCIGFAIFALEAFLIVRPHPLLRCLVGAVQKARTAHRRSRRS